ncbi:presenilin family intramembrane aspartyl protease PSH [Methanolapillus ohkumae]|uniref:Presenilin n=1 Tax=Methanolapillus ohkumae TaxID=3028298 RepID=A0AA96ZW45_9EURY|nr:hypothetical protein MsAm2_13920 [Methanosarcinaceae archaeon Am2]
MEQKQSSDSLLERLKEIMPMIFMGLLILTVQLGSLWLSSREYITEQPVFENPESIGNAIYYILVLLIFSAIVVFAVKKNKSGFIRGVVYLSITVTFFYVINSILSEFVPPEGIFLLLSGILAVLLSVVLYKHPEWYVIDLAGLVISIGACAIIGVSLSILPIFILLLALLIYDFISVYKTKHMLTLASGMMNLKLPILFVIPKHLNYSYIDDDFLKEIDGESNEKSEKKADKESDSTDIEKMNFDETASEKTGSEKTDSKKIDSEKIDSEKTDADKKERGALFMGLGDAVIPTLLVVSANYFIPHTGFISTPALLTMIGTFAGFAGLMYAVSKGKPQAGLPFLNTGAMAGFLIGAVVSGISLMSFLPI